MAADQNKLELAMQALDEQLVGVRRELREKIWAVVKNATRRIGHGQFCNCVVYQHPAHACDCGKVDTEKALVALMEELKRG